MDWFLVALINGWRSNGEITRLRAQVLAYQIRLGEVPPMPPPSRTERLTVWVLRRIFRMKLTRYAERVEAPRRRNAAHQVARIADLPNAPGK